MATGLALLTAALFMTATATAQVTANDSEDSDVTVSVSETIAVDVQPANLDYPNAEVGNRNTTSDRGFGAVEIENTGSVKINKIWLNGSAPSSDPFGTGTASNYDAGNFLEVQFTDSIFSTTIDDWHYINRKEYMWSSDSGPETTSDTDIPSYIQADGWASDPYEVGAVRRGNETIFFAIDAQSDTCNGDITGGLRVGNVSALDNRLGTVDFTSSTEYGWTEYDISSLSNVDYGVASVDLNWTYTGSGSESSYDLLTRCGPSSGQPHVYANKFNVNAVGSSDLAADANADHTRYLLDTSNSGSMLAPGDQATVNTAIDVPEGVSSGSVGAGKLRVLITADPDA